MREMGLESRLGGYEHLLLDQDGSLEPSVTRVAGESDVLLWPPQALHGHGAGKHQHIKCINLQVFLKL